MTKQIWCSNVINNRGSKEVNEMKRINKFTAVLTHDKRLLSLFSGMILSCIGLLSVTITALVWYL